jgi:hypothetical protein
VSDTINVILQIHPLFVYDFEVIGETVSIVIDKLFVFGSDTENVVETVLMAIVMPKSIGSFIIQSLYGSNYGVQKNLGPFSIINTYGADNIVINDVSVNREIRDKEKNFTITLGQ